MGAASGLAAQRLVAQLHPNSFAAGYAAVDSLLKARIRVCLRAVQLIPGQDRREDPDRIEFPSPGEPSANMNVLRIWTKCHLAFVSE